MAEVTEKPSPPADRTRGSWREQVASLIRRQPTEVRTRKTLSGKTVEEKPPTPYETFVLGGLQRKQVYQGTVRPNVKAKRRARAKVAKASRRVNRA